MNTHQNLPSLTQRARQEQERPAPHPFRVGEMYANRRGNYEVMQIAPPRMTIRYADGELVTADIAILARIWDNMQAPPEQPETGPRQRSTTRQAAAAPRTAKAPEPRAEKAAPKPRAARAAPKPRAEKAPPKPRAAKAAPKPRAAKAAPTFGKDEE